jgi:hypothetical protein
MWFLIGNLILLLIYFIEIGVNSRYSEIGNTIFGFSLLPLKKVHTEWGDFYIKLVYKNHQQLVYKNHQHYVYLYEVKGIFVEKIDYWEYSDLESMKSLINSKIAYRYGARRSITDYIKKVKKEVEGWNGFTSVQLERDKKLEDLTK